MSVIIKALNKPRVSVKVQTVAALLATAAAVALPQLCHLIGGKPLSTALLPMHLPVLLVGLLAGPLAGAAAGMMGPLASFLLTGMPIPIKLPLMIIELMAFGLFAGLFRNLPTPSAVKVLLAQLAGRLCYAAALALAIYPLGISSLSMTSALTSSTTGLPGAVLQLALIPLILNLIKKQQS